MSVAIRVLIQVVDPKELTQKDFADLWEIWNWLMAVQKIPGGALISRFGEVRRNAGSIRHFHHNAKVPSGDKRYQETLAKDLDDWERKGPLLLIFEKMRTGTSLENLSVEEQNLVKDRL